TDDFVKEFAPFLEQKLIGTKAWRGKMSKSEMMTIVIFFHLSSIRCFSWYYKQIVKEHLSSYLPDTYAYERFVAQMKHIQLEFYAFRHHFCIGKPTEANYIDSKPLAVCHIKREKLHRVFLHIVQKGVNSKGFFYGLKLYLLCNQQGEILKIRVTSGNVADNNAELLKSMLKGFESTVYGDKGYISKLKKVLQEQGCKLITKIRKHMKKPVLTQKERYYLKKRTLIETVFGQMVNQCQIEHTRHRSPINCMVNLWAGIIAYNFLDHLPKIADFDMKDLDQANVVLLKY
ncbi:MAG TPA: IS982 family transposase, partial [Microscillaceae bacterium]|nr:IS982 family transposase [Microscillaceae bacterium]